MTDTIFIPRPIEEKPEKDGYYACLNNEVTLGREFLNGNWIGQNWGFTHWLQPIDRKEYIRQIAAEAWEAALDWANWTDAGCPDPRWEPDLETYLNNLK
jgi:hypothetical protein